VVLDRAVVVGVRTVEPVGEQTSAEADRNRQWREVGVGAQILRDLGITDMILLSSIERPIIGLEGYGLRVVEQRPLPNSEERA